ncbi:MAG: putative AlkP superfamily pyrophosphatase or phosphodiesterase [Myxococcota bacterium]|jgi:predicted AlkP superfamily pyrophosphatase or phosphodiesterase
MNKILVLNIVGLTPELLHSGDMPNLLNYAQQHQVKNIDAAFPAVTCTAQANMLMGTTAAEHGAVANGWYHRDLSEVWLWRQSVNLITANGKSIFKRWRQAHADDAQQQSHQMFWWFNLPSDADFSVTPRPTYYADGRKGPDVHTHPDKLRSELTDSLGEFPLFNFWGPTANIKSTQWIIDATLLQMRNHPGGLHLSYLPHLDYDLQRYGVNSTQAAAACRELDAALAPLLQHDAQTQVMVVSEYGIEDVDQCVYPNKILNEAGLLQVYSAKNGSLLDPGNSRAFAVCDHQVAHIYVNDPQDIAQVTQLLSACEGVESVQRREDVAELNHPRSGELIITAKQGCWFAYPYWLEHQTPPDFARCVEIHRKPGYDPCELFLDPKLKFAKLRVALKLLKKMIGMRYSLNVIPLDTSLVKGSHGRRPSRAELGPLIIAPSELMPDGECVDSTAVFEKLV